MTTFLIISFVKMRSIAIYSAVALLASQANAFLPHSGKPASFAVRKSSELFSSVLSYGSTFRPANMEDITVAAAPKVAQRWRKSTKQLVTLGPASSSEEVSR